MPIDCITLQNSGYFSSLIIDYLNEKSDVKELYNRFPKVENFKSQIKEKTGNFNDIDDSKRQVLVEVLQKQYASFKISDLTQKNISLLQEAKTFTITTGHQLNLFTGPLYFLYKIVSVINLCRELKTKYPENNFVPVFWMATEDHDFEEINHFKFKEDKISFNKKTSGPVGRLSTAGLDEVLFEFEKKISTNENGTFIIDLFRKSYLEQSNLANATRNLANTLFYEEGLVIIDGDNRELKKLFAPNIKDELLQQASFKNVTETNKKLIDYNIQVNPREINLFYIDNNVRERILLENNKYKINNTKLEFSKAEIVQLVDNNPEKFSPNVILRPLYQEVILPNLCYVGGGGEIAYWLQLKTNFESNNITFPILLVRNSALLATQKQYYKLQKLNLSWSNLFIKQATLINNKTKEFSQFTINFSEQKKHLQNQFLDLYKIAIKTNKSFVGAVKAQETKQIKGLDNLEKRLLKAEKQTHKEKLDRIITLQNSLFPKQGLQERTSNFSEFYIEYGDKLLDKLFLELHPLEQEFKIIIL